ncbi:MAG: DUF6680 family protein [Ramlibacter sp.]
MEFSTFAIVLATFLGPVVAVQAQKYLERAREVERRKIWVFTMLMATRHDRLAVDHVRAINSIDLAFYGKFRRFNRAPSRSQADEEVLTSWREYFQHLNIDQTGWDDQKSTEWMARSDELFLNLLEKLAIATRYVFDRAQLRSAHYSPMAHHQNSVANQTVRRLLIEILAGKRAIAVKAEAQSPPV